MKKIFIRLIMLVLIVSFVVGFIEWNPDSAMVSWVLGKVYDLKGLYGTHSIVVISIFCLAHLVSSFFGIPGGCTALNIFSGALFGMWMGCLVVYPVTIFSSFVGYIFGRRVKSLKFLSKYEEKIEAISEKIEKSGFLFLIFLRLSPLLPFGVLNVILGVLKVPRELFLSSTFIGIFFDVVLLNSIGAALVLSKDEFVFDRLFILLLFLVVLASFSLFRIYLLDLITRADKRFQS